MPICKVHLGAALEHLRTFCDWITEFRKTGFEKCLSDAHQLIEKSSYDLPTDFKNKRVAKKKRMLEYEGSVQPIQSPKNLYEIDFFNTMIDSLINNLDSRFMSLKHHFKNFGFRILLTILVGTASAERSFYLKNTMGQKRLSALAVLSIEADIASKLNYDTIIKEFSKVKSRKFLFP